MQIAAMPCFLEIGRLFDSMLIACHLLRLLLNHHTTAIVNCVHTVSALLSLLGTGCAKGHAFELDGILWQLGPGLMHAVLWSTKSQVVF